MRKNAGPGAWEAPRAGDKSLLGDEVSDTTQAQPAPASSLIIPRRQILTPDAHATTLHGSGRGRVTIAQRVNGRWKQRSIAIADIGYVAGQLAGAPDTYLSQNRFYGWGRTIANLAQLDALFSDLDYYTLAPAIAHLRPEHVLPVAYERLDEYRIPPPTVAISTGRGIALIWIHSPVPRAAIGRWQACQRTIYEALKDLGADRNAIDATRVLRLIGTSNSKSNSLVMPLTDVGTTWGFDALADEILPLKREELERLRAARAKARHRRRSQIWPLEGFNRVTLSEGRLTDLQNLLHYRFFGALPPGQRNGWLFCAAVNMAYLVSSDCLPRELAALAAHVACWTEGETRSRMSAVQNRAKLAYLGQQIAYGGKLVDPRYRFRTDTIIERLQITEAEMRGADLRHLVTEDILRERDRARDERRRREAGAIDRATYLTKAVSNTKPWEAEGISRRTWYRR